MNLDIHVGHLVQNTMFYDESGRPCWQLGAELLVLRRIWTSMLATWCRTPRFTMNLDVHVGNLGGHLELQDVQGDPICPGRAGDAILDGFKRYREAFGYVR